MMSNAMTVEEYKRIYDANNYKGNGYEAAKFITFLMNKGIVNKEIEQFTGLKKSQVFSYKKVIKNNKVEELRTTAFRNVLKSCMENTKPKIEEDLVQAIESEAAGLCPLSIASPPPMRPLKGTRAYYEGPHYFEEFEMSSDRTTFYKNDFCPCGLGIGPTESGQKFVHIPEFKIETQTYLELDEVMEYNREIRCLKKRVEELEMENAALRMRTKRTSV